MGHDFNNFLGAVTGVGPRLNAMALSRLQQAKLRGDIWQDPAGRAAMFADPEMLKLLGTKGTNVARGGATVGAFPQLGSDDPAILPYITQVPEGLPPEVMTPERATMMHNQALTDQLRQQQQMFGGGGEPPGFEHLVPTTKTYDPSTGKWKFNWGFPPGPVTRPEGSLGGTPDTGGGGGYTPQSGGRRLQGNSLLATDPRWTEAATRHNTPPGLAQAVAEQESSFNPNAVGVPTKYGRARGLGQFIPATGARYGITDQNWNDPGTQIDAINHHLSDLIQQTGGDVRKALVLYHGGGTDPTGMTSDRYAGEVLNRWTRYRGQPATPADQGVTAAPSPAPGGEEDIPPDVWAKMPLADRQASLRRQFGDIPRRGTRTIGPAPAGAPRRVGAAPPPAAAPGQPEPPPATPQAAPQPAAQPPAAPAPAQAAPPQHPAAQLAADEERLFGTPAGTPPATAGGAPPAPEAAGYPSLVPRYPAPPPPGAAPGGAPAAAPPPAGGGAQPPPPAGGPQPSQPTPRGSAGAGDVITRTPAREATPEDIADAMQNVPGLAPWMAARGMDLQRDPITPARDPFVINATRNWAAKRAALETQLKKQADLGATDKSQLKRVAAAESIMEMYLTPVDDSGFAPIDVSVSGKSALGKGYIRGTRTLRKLTEGVPVLGGAAEAVSPGGEGLLPFGPQTIQQQADEPGTRGRAATTFQALEMAAPMLVKSLGDAGNLSEQEQAIVRKLLLPSGNQTYEQNLEKVHVALNILKQVKTGIGNGTLHTGDVVGAGEVHDFTLNALNAFSPQNR